MGSSAFDESALEGFQISEFLATKPFPWVSLKGVLRQEAFERLASNFPALSIFAESNDGYARPHGQRGHRRFVLTYGAPSRHTSDKNGACLDSDLHGEWRDFISEMKEEGSYRRLIQKCFGHSNFSQRYVWHATTSGQDVSPHIDGPQKLGTHIFYFNLPQEWDAAWGGSTLVLSGKRTAAMNPEFDDFACAVDAPIYGNTSLLFMNGPDAWHGVRPLMCPAGKFRRIFNVIFEHRQ